VSTQEQGPEQVIHRVLDHMRSQTGKLDGTDASIWFVFGMLSNQHAQGRTDLTTDMAALALHTADTLAATCRDVEVDVVASEASVHDINAVQQGGPVQLVLNWVWQCLQDPETEHIVFKYAGALRDFGESARADRLYRDLEEYRAHMDAKQ
jgi:hypothetical protein